MFFIHCTLFYAKAVEKLAYNIKCTPALNQTIPYSPMGWIGSDAALLPYALNLYKLFKNTLELQKGFVFHWNLCCTPPVGGNLPSDPPNFYYTFFTIKLHRTQIFFIRFLIFKFFLRFLQKKIVLSTSSIFLF